jgi:hypothetical protein
MEEYMTNRWWLHPTDPTADVAVTQVWPHPTADIISVNVQQFANPDIMRFLDIGIGDEVFSTGLFTPAPGAARNIPILRHGNIAMMPEEQIQTELGYADVYLVEARSLGGISGSPVFVRHTVDFKVNHKSGQTMDVFGAGLGATLLGLMHGHWDIRESEKNQAFFTHDRKHGVNMGIAIVVPAVKILETLHQPELVNMRREAERQMLAHERRNIVPGVDSAKPDDKEPTFTKDDFEAALKKTSRKLTPKK